jgi:2-polyprenyl-6-hydroxyphenyl methylase/3-demethylubiquinone-9 3-methyltransferase
LLHTRFKRFVAEEDVRLCALRSALEPLAGKCVLDLGCGKGRFGSALAEAGADVVVGLDLSSAMLAEASGLSRVLGSARRLPFAERSFDGVIAVEVFEHVHPESIDPVLCEAQRVLRPGGILSIVDKNAGAWHAGRPWLPGLAVKWIDERRGRWMYPCGGVARERWFWPAAFQKRLRRWFVDVQVSHLISPSEASWWVFRKCPQLRLLTLWMARAPGGALE